VKSGAQITKDEGGRLSAEEISDIIERVRSGDNEAFWRLVQPHQRSLRVAAYSLLHNADDAAEIVQETMLKALRNIHQLKDGQSFRSWLMSIAMNEARMRIRKGHEEPWPDEDVSDELPFKPRDFADWHETPLQAVERKEIQDAVHRALQLLSPRLREVFVLRDIQHFSVPETASIVGTPTALISLRLHRARLEMREFLAPLFRRTTSPWVPMKMMMMDMPAMLVHRVVSCKTAVRELSRYIDGELDSRLRHQIDEHVKHCSRCKIILSTTRKVIYLVADDEALLPPFESRSDAH
jgi:RNA polymerase sigma-70 factor (ECF subfamily)